MTTQTTKTESAPAGSESSGLLTEQVGKLLTDTVSVKLQLVEDGKDAGKIVVRGEFGRAGIATENKRVYPQSLWEREFKRLDLNLEKRQVFGELDHPTDGRTSLNRVSHILTGLQLGEGGIVMGEAEVLDTERGKNLAAMLKAGCSVGVSSRGYGSTKTNEMGEEVVQEDYRLVTFDFVAEPADTKAIPQVFFEENQHMATGPELDAKLSEEKAKLKEEFAKELVATLITVKSEAKAQAKAEMMSDPEVAGSKMALEQIIDVLRPFVVSEQAEGVIKTKDEEIAKLKIAIAEKDEQIVSLNSDLKVLSETAREVGYKLYVEQQLVGDPDATLIRKMLGDLTVYAKTADIKVKIESVRADMAQKQAERAAIEEQTRVEAEKVASVIREETQAAKLETQKAKAESEVLKEALEKALEGQKEVALRLYAEKRLANHPQAPKMRNILESSHPSNKAEVDQILSSYSQEPTRDPEVLEQTRARVRTLTKGGGGSTALEEEAPAPSAKRQQVDFEGLGVSLNELQRLSGIDRK